MPSARWAKAIFLNLHSGVAAWARRTRGGQIRIIKINAHGLSITARTSIKPRHRCVSTVPPAEARLRFASLVTIDALDYKFKLTAAFQKALDDTEAAVTLHYAHPPAPGAHPPAPH